METPLEMLQKVAHALGPLRDEVVFVGGTMPALLITDPTSPLIRATKDVDLIVDRNGSQKPLTPILEAMQLPSKKQTALWRSWRKFVEMAE